MSRFVPQNNKLDMDELQVRVKRLENQLETLTADLTAVYVTGRLRFDRASPANSADVNTFDTLYDIVRDTSYEYILINNAGTPTWYRIALSTF
jgi:hypothetical protein